MLETFNQKMLHKDEKFVPEKRKWFSMKRWGTGARLPPPQMAKLAQDDLHAGHHVVHEPSSNALIHSGVLFAASLDVEELDERLNSDALDEHCPVDDSDGCGDEHIGVWHLLSSENGGKSVQTNCCSRHWNAEFWK